MRIRRRFAAIALILCLAILHLQVWAATVMGCRHAAGFAGGTTAVCPVHQTAPQTSTEDPTEGYPARLHCQKCALEYAVGVPALMVSAPLLPEIRGPQAQIPMPSLHFYWFTPDSPYRPPIC